jgi:hypothetical protein
MVSIGIFIFSDEVQYRNGTSQSLFFEYIFALCLFCSEEASNDERFSLRNLNYYETTVSISMVAILFGKKTKNS